MDPNFSMSELEIAALKHASEWLSYARSKQYAIDLAEDKRRRASKDKASGHTPNCSLTRCAPECKKG